MIGIPVSIERDGKDETIYLSTRRSGENGNAMHAAMKTYREQHLFEARLSARMGLITISVGKIPDDADSFVEKLRGLAEDMDTLAKQAAGAREAKADAALEVVRLALLDNHGPDTEAIMDCLTDKQIEQMVGIIQTGETPADFFPSRATRPSASTTTPAAAAPGAHSSKPGSTAPTSKPAG